MSGNPSVKLGVDTTGDMLMHIWSQERELTELRAMLARLHASAGERMMAEEPTGEQVQAFLAAWTDAGELLRAKEVRHG
jgi:hypothetical protein